MSDTISFQMTRALQDRLALANIKITHGWQHRSITSIEPELEQEIKRKRTLSNCDQFSTDSSVSGHYAFAKRNVSSPFSGPIFSDDLPHSGSSHGSMKRFKVDSLPRMPASSSHTRKSRRTLSKAANWKSAYHLPQSSPSYRTHSRLPTLENNYLSFASETPTFPDSSSASEDDDQDIPIHSFQVTETHMASSPPCTPPPALSRSARLSAKSFNSPITLHKNPGKEGADLLLYLASSPSPAFHPDRTPMAPPSTPPAKNTPLPSSMMGTPGGMYGFGPHTPGPTFNFADFVNVTPSPAQAAWPKTPGTIKASVATMETRRQLKADSKPKTIQGLGMELGGELMT